MDKKMDFNRFNDKDLEALLRHLEAGRIDEVENMFRGRDLVFSRNRVTVKTVKAEQERRRQRNARALEKTQTQLRRNLLGGSKKRSKKGSKKRRVNKKKSSKKQRK